MGAGAFAGRYTYRQRRDRVDIESAIPDLDAEIVLYCGGGYRSALAAENLQKMGYTDAISMDGGFREWSEAGHSIETD